MAVGVIVAVGVYVAVGGKEAVGFSVTTGLAEAFAGGELVGERASATKVDGAGVSVLVRKIMLVMIGSPVFTELDA